MSDITSDQKPPVIPSIFRAYLISKSNDRVIRFMKRTGPSEERPSIVVSGTKYSWGWFEMWWEFRWTGPNSYYNTMPDEIASKLPLWNKVWMFSHAYRQHLAAEAPGNTWTDLEREHYRINPERRAALEEVKALCDKEEWVAAMNLWENLK